MIFYQDKWHRRFDHAQSSKKFVSLWKPLMSVTTMPRIENEPMKAAICFLLLVEIATVCKR